MTPTRKDMKEILKTLRETLSGLEMVEAGRWFRKDPELEDQVIRTILETSGALDLYMTGSLEGRGVEDAVPVKDLIAGTAWEMLLSDGTTTLILRRVTPENLQTVELGESTPQTKRVWKRINTARSQAREFGFRR